MATATRTGQLTQTGVTGAGEWDSRLNRLLEDLQETVIPTDSRSRNAAEYREYRLTQRTQVNDEPPQAIDEKWVEIGNLMGGGVVSGNVTDSAYGSSSRFTESKSVAFADETTTSRTTSSQRTPQIEFLAPANCTTELKSGPTSPSNYGIVPSGSSRSPKIERKEFFSKASYTTMIKGSERDDLPYSSTVTDSSSSHRLLDDLIPTDFPALGSTASNRPQGLDSMSSTTETKRTYMSSTSDSQRYGGLQNGGAPSTIGAPMYTSTPMKPSGTHSTSSYTREIITDRNATPPPKHAESLKTPPMIRKILQSSSKESTTSHHHHTSNNTSTTTSSSKPPPVGGVPLPILHTSNSPSSSLPLKSTPVPSYDDPPERLGARYYTSTVTTEHRERDVSPIRRFPSPQPPKQSGDPPKRLDELLATFEDTSYSRSTTYGGNEGPHKSVPYGPGTHSIQPIRTVRIDENVTTHPDESSELIQRKNVTQYQNPAYGNKKEPLEPTMNREGPPVFYPPGQMFTKTEEEVMKQEVDGKGKGKGKMKMERSYKEKEKMKSKHSEKEGGGAVPVPVCLPVCCAAPCVIM